MAFRKSSVMDEKILLTQELNELEAEYRTWRIAVIHLERGIDEMERQLKQSYDRNSSPSASQEYSPQLVDVRDQHRFIENKLDRIRLRLDEMRSRLDGMA
jgi:phage shock protein A